MMPSKRLGFLVLVVALLTWNCRQQTQPDEAPTEQEHVEEHGEEHEGEEAPLGRTARAEVMNADGETMGVVTFTQTAEGLRVEGEIGGLTPGLHGFHVHETGQCDPPDFTSAGGHFNPQGHPHGGPEAAPGQRHTGDFGNIEAGEDGVARFSLVDPLATLGEGENAIVSKAVIVHAQADDLESQPTGDAGGRVGCGLIEVTGE